MSKGLEEIATRKDFLKKIFTSIRRIDGNNKTVIVDICGEMINRNPTKEELRGLKRHLTTKEILKLPEEEKRQHLLEFLRYFNMKNESVPGQLEFNNNQRYPSFMTYVKCFGSWNNAIRDAGFVPDRYITDEELLDNLTKFYEKNERPPTSIEFNGENPRYPSTNTYSRHFGSWSNALKLVGLDVESMVKNGVVETKQQKARLAEMIVMDYLDNHFIDLSGENCTSPFDGICPEGKIYDVKSSRFYEGDMCWKFHFHNVYKCDIEILYLLAFNEDYTELVYAWRVYASKFLDKDTFSIGIYYGPEFNIENMRDYEITKELREVFNKHGYF
jgi:hypothetical protein